MNEFNRVALCLLTAPLACSIMAISGVGTFHLKVSHPWYYGLITFPLIYTLLMLVVVRTRVATSLWLIPICAALAWLADSLAFFIEPETAATRWSRLQSSLRGAKRRSNPV